MLYLYPLLLQAYKGVAPHAWLRGSLDGIPPDQMARLFDGGARLKRGVMTHITLHARLEERYGDRRRDVKQELKEAGFSRELVKTNVRKMRKLVEGLSWDPPKGVWTEYGRVNTYTDEDAEAKAAFVRAAAAASRPALAWDLGCNDGRYARIVADEGARVVAVDSDQGPVELLYRDLRAEGDERVLPLTMNLTDPSPGLGWRGAERRPLAERGRPDLVLCLALVHHVTITANVPMRAWLDWLAELGARLVIEFPTREDPMVQRLLAAKKAGTHDDYERGAFERCLAEAFDVERSERLASGTRVLYLATPRRRPAAA
jgi:SAM-dependent methyltransferase